MYPFAFIIGKASLPDCVTAADMVEGGNVPAVTNDSIPQVPCFKSLLNMHMGCVELFLDPG